MKRFFLLLCCMVIQTATSSAEQVSICFNYSCLTQADATYSDQQLALLEKMFSTVPDAEAERLAISRAMGLLLVWAGEQTAIDADKGGNLADEGAYGKMDCIDHSTTSTRLLRMMQSLGMIRFHHVREPVRRGYLGIFQIHYSALIEEIPAPGEDNNEADDKRYAVDTWFYDNGQPAVIIPLKRWLSGESPNEH